MKFSTKHLRVYLAADSVAVVCRWGLVRREVKCASTKVTLDEAAPQPWAPALRALGELLEREDWHGVSIDIALSSEFVRLALVQGIAQNLSSQEMRGLAQGMFARVLGDAAGAWNLRYCAADRSAVLAAATEKPMLAALEDLARARHCTLRSVSPLWSCAVNRQRKRLARRSAWLVVAEPRAVAFGLMERGHWRTMRAKPLDAVRGLGVARLIERESRFLGTETRDLIFVGHAPEGERYSPDWKVEELPIADTALGAVPAACLPAVLAGC